MTIFTADATYHERVLGEPIPDREAIREYWQTKVVAGAGEHPVQAAVDSTLTANGTVIAEWLAEFDDVAQGVRKRMREVAILEFDGPLIASLREYWASEQIGQLTPAEH